MTVRSRSRWERQVAEQLTRTVQGCQPTADLVTSVQAAVESFATGVGGPDRRRADPHDPGVVG